MSDTTEYAEQGWAAYHAASQTAADAIRERDALRADLARLERQANASVTKEVYAAQAETVTQLRADLDSAREEITLRQAAFVVLRADLRACAKALEHVALVNHMHCKTVADKLADLPHTGDFGSCQAPSCDKARAALARPGCRDAPT